MAEARTGNNSGSGRSMAWLDVRGNLCLLLSPASSAELPMQQGSWKWSLACHQVRWGCRVWGCHFPYLLPDECAEQADFVHLSPRDGEADMLGLGLSRRAPRTCPLACSIWWDVRGAAAPQLGAWHGVAASWHHVAAGGPVRGSAAGERTDRIRGARCVQSQLLAGVWYHQELFI